MKLDFPNVTLFGADTADLNRLLLAFEICMGYANFGSMKIVANIPEKYTTDEGVEVIGTKKINSIRDYSEFILKDLNDHIETDFVLIVQHDGFILNPNAWDAQFLNYDYIGAPWLINGELVVGNGGFSIRSKKLLELTQSDTNIRLGSKEEDRYNENEDWVICNIFRNYLEDKGVNFAPVELATQFSLEQNELLGGKWTNQFGFHGLRWTDISNWLQANPEYKIDNPLDQV